MNNIKTLLSQVSDISKKYEEIAKLTGENYNVFRILKLTTAEVKAHSAFIGELLNPKGCHDQGGVFLQLFLGMLEKKLEEKDFKPIAGFDCENATAKVEKYIGKISDCENNGGQIDIIVTDNNKKAIIIENKIHAKDRWKQLLRYNNFGAANHKDQYILLYLTLYGTPASNQSTGKIKENPDAEAENIEKEEETLSKEGLDTIENIKKESNINVINISYEKDILAWLEKCKEKAVNHPMLRESIAQYINLIKHLTQQTINKKMEEEMINTVLASKENLAAYEYLSNKIKHDKVKKEAWAKIKESLRKIIEKDDSLKFTITKDEDLPKGKKPLIAFEKQDNPNVFVGLSLKKEVGEGLIIGLIGPNNSDLFAKFPSLNSKSKKRNKEYIVYIDYPESKFKNWYLKDLNKVLFSDKKFYDGLIKTVGEIFEAIKK